MPEILHNDKDSPMLRNMQILWLTIGLIISVSIHAEIYRWIDENGNVVYSDQSHPKAKMIDLPPSTIYTPTEYIQSGIDSDNEQTEPDITVIYELRIIEPADDESIWVNNGDLSVTLSIDPPLDIAQGDEVVVELDGEPVGEPQTSTTLQLQNLNRGSHTLSAHVVSVRGEMLSEPRSVTFHLHRTSILNNANPNP